MPVSGPRTGVPVRGAADPQAAPLLPGLRLVLSARAGRSPAVRAPASTSRRVGRHLVSGSASLGTLSQCRREPWRGSQKSTGDTALSELKRVVDLLLTLRRADANGFTAQTVADDPCWDTPEKTRRHVAMLWGDLQRAVTAEVGSALVRQVTDWTIDDFTPRIVVGEPRDFDAASPDDEPYGWLPLAVAHCREAGWDFSRRRTPGRGSVGSSLRLHGAKAVFTSAAC